MTEREITPTEKYAGLSAWMRRYANGEDLAFTEIYRILAPKMRALARRKVQDAAAVEDIVQASFFKAHLARDRFAIETDQGGDRAVATWYFVIARNTATDYLRRVARSRIQDLHTGPNDDRVGFDQLASHDPNAEDTIIADQSQKMLMEWLKQALTRLPEAHREAVVLHKLQGMPMAQVAEIQGARLGTVRVRAHRAYQQLGSLWAERQASEAVH